MSFGLGGVTSSPASVSTFATATSPTKYTAGTVSNNVFDSVRDLFTRPTVNTATFSASDFNLVLKMLNTSGNARLVSNPTLVTLNNVEATVNVGDEYPIPNYTYNQEKGSFEVAGFTFRPLGVVLKVTPQVNAAGFIKMSVEPSVSFVNGVVNFGTANIPIINNKTTKTQVSLKNGHTMGIGGLIEVENKSDSTKVPLLGDIPILGNVFKSKGRSEKLHNLVIFITAKTLDVNEPKVEDVFDPRALKAIDLKKDDLPGYRSGEPAFPKN